MGWQDIETARKVTLGSVLVEDIQNEKNPGDCGAVEVDTDQISIYLSLFFFWRYPIYDIYHFYLSFTFFHQSV